MTSAHGIPQRTWGNIAGTLPERRGIFKDMKYLDTDLWYSLRIAIKWNYAYDFFWCIKSGRGYASFDYEMIGYAKSDLSKAGYDAQRRVVDALSLLFTKDKLMHAAENGWL